MSIKSKLVTIGIDKALNYIYRNPEKNLLKAMNMADKFAGNNFPQQRAVIRDAIANPDNVYHTYINRIFHKEVEPKVFKKFAINFFVNSALTGGPIQEKIKAEHGCNVPWAILLDPTSACNLKCTGCWAAEYGNKLNLTYDEIDNIITQGKELGIFMYVYTGGEPLVRKADILKICEKHNDCTFLCFTNGTLIDEQFADDMLRVGNFVPAISLEGDEVATDGRRGDNVYQKVMNALKILKEKKLIYGISSCYTSKNYTSLSSEEYFDKLIEMGAWFVWYFHYMPVGNEADTSLLLSPSQREDMIKRVRELRERKPLFAMDFQNDAEYVNGCIAGGRAYLHINPNGDVEPCVFIHYSDSNIREKSLLECLKSPLMMAYKAKQPFNHNMLQPCPMLENPHILRDMVKTTGAKSTDLQSPEDVDHLCDKCDTYAQQWKPSAERLYPGTGINTSAAAGCASHIASHAVGE